MTFVLIGNLDRGNALVLERADIIDVNALGRRHDSSLHGVFFAVLTAHAGQRDFGPRTEGPGLKSLGHLQKGLCDQFFNVC